MTKEEFLDMKVEFAAVTLKFEQLNKEITLFRARYSKSFFDLTQKTKNVMVENGILSNLLALKLGGAEDEKIEEARNQLVEKALNDEASDVLNHNAQVAVIERNDKTPIEEKRKFEEEFETFIMDYHPYVNINTDPELSGVIKLLLRCYYENNIVGFYEVFSMHENALKHDELEEKDYARCQNLYLQFKAYYQNRYNNVKDEFPMNKRSVFFSEKGILDEKASLQKTLDKALEMNEALQKDYETQFGNKFVVPFQY